MRDELRSLEGSLVVCSGRVKKIRQEHAGFKDVLLTLPELLPWDGTSKVARQRWDAAVKTDHLWVRLPDYVRVERLMRTLVVGICSYYRRADGSVDLGLECLPSFDMDSVMCKAIDAFADRTVKDLSKAKDARELLKDVLYCLYHQGDGGWVWSSNYTLDEAAPLLIRCYKFVDRSIKATEERLSTAPNNGRCRRLDLARPRSQQRRHAVGF